MGNEILQVLELWSGEGKARRASLLHELPGEED